MRPFFTFLGWSTVYSKLWGARHTTKLNKSVPNVDVCTNLLLQGADVSSDPADESFLKSKLFLQLRRHCRSEEAKTL